MIVKFKKLDPEAKTPTKAYEDGTCFDLYSVEDCVLQPGEVKMIKVGIAIQLPPGFYASIYTRGSHALEGIQCHHAIIDQDYRGEIGPIVFNFSRGPIEIRKGDKIAQFTLEKAVSTKLKESQTLKETQRGEKGLGSTGR